jgi:hypothetical protein
MTRHRYMSLYIIFNLNYSITMDCPLIEIKTTSSRICVAAEMREQLVTCQLTIDRPFEAKTTTITTIHITYTANEGPVRTL